MLLLETFLAAYPPANMPKRVAAVQALERVADGQAMAWSDENVGNELVDAQNGGVIEANIEAGRTISRLAAESALPPGSVIPDVRDAPVIIEDLGRRRRGVLLLGSGGRDLRADARLRSRL